MRTFYSLPNNYGGTIQEEIQQLIYYSNGGYTWYHVYNDMPVHYRKFHLRKLQDIKDKEAEEMKKSQGKKTPKGSSGTPSSVQNAMQKGG